MNKIAEFWENLQAFFGGVKSELKKCSWPSRSELMDSTIVVIVSVAFFGVYVGLSDWVIMKLLAVIIR